LSAQLRIYQRSNSGVLTALQQGELLTGLVQINLETKTIGSKSLRVEAKIHPFALVVSQDCDLEQDFKSRQGTLEANPDDKLLPNLLFCEIALATSLRGNRTINTRIWSQVSSNKHERYHFFQRIEPADDALCEGLPELSADFKRYFSVPTAEVYRRIELGETRRRSVLASPYLEHFSSRFSYYLSRVALPSDHASE
jgi:hypothetical protein